MKKIILLLFSLVFTSYINKTFAQDNLNTKHILDSLNVLIKTKGFVEGYTNSPSEEEIRLKNIYYLLFGLPYIEAKKLTTDTNELVRIYAFNVISNIYFDSLNRKDLLIFKDKTKILFYAKGQTYDVDLTVGTFCKMMYNQTIENKKIDSYMEKVRQEIIKFIEKNSKYSESYVSIDFSEYSQSESGNGKNKYYEIKHVFSMKQKNGDLIETRFYFTLNKNFDIIKIEKEKTSIITDPPNLDIWTDIFGE
jgi:hypothetical protein